MLRPICLSAAMLAGSGSANVQGNSPAIPPALEMAGQALLDSPRHGEWVDVDLPGSDVKLRTFIVYPERAEAAPMVIVIHEIFGLTDWVRAVADQLAAEGFIALAPDLLSGKGPGGGGTESFGGDAVREAIRALDQDEVAQRLDAVRAYGLGLPSAAGTSATVGFCWGGSISFAYATRQPRLEAAVVYYGSAPTDPAALGRIEAPVLGIYGGDDARINATVPATVESMRQSGKSFTHHTYDGAGHAFLRQQSAREANRAAALRAWPETIRFLRQHLESPRQ